MAKLKYYPLVPPAEEDWEKELEEYLNTEEHRFDCCGYSEGLDCCLNKKWIREFIKRIIEKKVPDAGFLQKILEDLELGMIMWRDDKKMHGKRLERYKRLEVYIQEIGRR